MPLFRWLWNENADKVDKLKRNRKMLDTSRSGAKVAHFPTEGVYFSLKCVPLILRWYLRYAREHLSFLQLTLPQVLVGINSNLIFHVHRILEMKRLDINLIYYQWGNCKGGLEARLRHYYVVRTCFLTVWQKSLDQITNEHWMFTITFTSKTNFLHWKGQYIFLTNYARTTGRPHVKKKNLDTDLTPFTKINPKWIIDLNMKCKKTELLKCHVKKLWVLWWPFRYNTKGTIHVNNNDRQELIKIKDFNNDYEENLDVSHLNSVGRRLHVLTWLKLTQWLVTAWHRSWTELPRDLCGLDYI